MAARVRDHTQQAYPPVSVGSSVGELFRWIADDAIDARWIAATPNGQPVGHVVVRPPRDYLTRHRLLRHEHPRELGQLFIDPQWEGSGLGARLVDTATMWIHAHAWTPALTVLTATPDAHRLYTRLGWEPIAVFPGVDGENTIMRHRLPPPVLLG